MFKAAHEAGAPSVRMPSVSTGCIPWFPPEVNFYLTCAVDLQCRNRSGKSSKPLDSL